jgi:hypothetical protein
MKSPQPALSSLLASCQPLNQAFQKWWKRLRDPTLALEAFNAALLAGKLIALRRDEGKPLRVVSATSYWRRARVVFDREEPLVVVVVEGGSVVPSAFFICEIGDADAAQTSPAATHGPKPGTAAAWIDTLWPNDEWRLMSAKEMANDVADAAKKRGLKKWPRYGAVATERRKREQT